MKDFDAQKVLDGFSNLSFEAYVGKNDFLVRKLALTVNIKSTDSALAPLLSYLPGSGSVQDVAISGVIKFKEFGKDFAFVAPENPRNLQDVFAEVLQKVQETASESAAVLAPVDQFETARDAQRRADLLGIANAVYMFAAEHNGNLPDTNKSVTISSFPSTSTCIGTAASCFNLSAAGEIEAAVNVQELIVPTYIAAMPKDPKTGTDADTGYMISRDANGRIVLTAKGEKAGQITVTR